MNRDGVARFCGFLSYCAMPLAWHSNGIRRPKIEITHATVANHRRQRLPQCLSRLATPVSNVTYPTISRVTVSMANHTHCSLSRCPNDRSSSIWKDYLLRQMPNINSAITISTNESLTVGAEGDRINVLCILANIPKQSPKLSPCS